MTQRKIKICIALVTVFTIVGTMRVVATNQIQIHTDKTMTTSSIRIQLNMNDKPADDKRLNVLTSADFVNGMIPQKVSVTNTATKAAYVRVGLCRQWRDTEGNVLINEQNPSLNTDFITCVTKNQEDWIAVQEDDITWFYYKKQLLPSETSSNVCEALLASKMQTENTNQYSNMQMQLHWEAQAVQTVIAQDAIEAEWGVCPEFTQQGEIAGIKKGEVHED